VNEVKRLAEELNEKQLEVDGNYYINVLHYGANRGASYARNTGFNHSTADWVLFLDDDVIPDENILDAYIGAIRRYPNSKVFVGHTELPESCKVFKQMLRACNVGYFYSISKQMLHPPWGVTANLLVRGSRLNSTIQFKHSCPKTG
jgi:glycosyltransferase involved in cell wall biosynthesis